MFSLALLLLATLACVLATPTVDRQPSATDSASASPTPADRLAAIPSRAAKIPPADDPWQPVAAPGWSKPVPLAAPINSAGAEDSPFVSPDGNELYFFYTPDLHIPANQQLFDGVTGIWVSNWMGGEWGEPRRIPLAGEGEAHLDGCEFILEDWMAFCSARQGSYRDIDLYTATRVNGEWGNIQNWGERVNLELQAGEMHVSEGGLLYFASNRPGGYGGYDLWVSQWNGSDWADPVNLGAPVNTSGDENRPYISPDGGELWFDRLTSISGMPGPAIYRSIRNDDGSWGNPMEIVSSFAGEPSLTGDGLTLYFTHHYFSADLSQMIEADIYVSRRETSP